MTGKSIVPAVRQQLIGRGYPVFSWYALMAGMGVFPDAPDLRPPTAQEACYKMAEIDDLIRRSAGNFPDHKRTLAQIPLRRHEPALQAYFW
jgi:hypothetical protein